MRARRRAREFQKQQVLISFFAVLPTVSPFLELKILFFSFVTKLMSSFTSKSTEKYTVSDSHMSNMNIDNNYILYISDVPTERITTQIASDHQTICSALVFAIHRNYNKLH